MGKLKLGKKTSKVKTTKPLEKKKSVKVKKENPLEKEIEMLRLELADLSVEKEELTEKLKELEEIKSLYSPILKKAKDEYLQELLFSPALSNDIYLKQMSKGFEFNELRY